MSEIQSAQNLEKVAKSVGSKTKFDAQMAAILCDYQTFCRRLRTATAAIQVLESKPTMVNTEQASEKYEAAQEMYEAISHGLGVAKYIANGAEEATAAADNRLKQINDEFVPIEDRWLRATKVFPETVETSEIASGGTNRIIDTSLKPEILTMETTPAEYRKWRYSLESYFLQNDIGLMKAKVQNAHVKACVSAEISELISVDVLDVPALDEEHGILSLIETVYNRKHTDTSKKLSLFMCKSKQGEKPISFVARLNELFQEADVATMSPDEIKSFFLIAGLNNTSLRNKLLDITEPTFNKLVEKVSAWTATQETAKAIDSTHNEIKVNAIKSANAAAARGGRGGGRGGRGGSGGRGRGWIEPPASIKNTPTSMAGRCNVCGDRGHMKKECSKAGSASCSECKQKGHFANVCMAEFYAWRDKTFGERGGKRAASVESKKDAKVNKASAGRRGSSSSEEE